MPAILTHDLFGRGVLEDATSLLNLRTPAERDAFLLGNQGPDPLFYLTIDPLMHKWSPLGNALHASAPAEVLLAMREAALRLVMTKIARTIAMDGEGASKLIEVQVTGADTKDDARKVVKTIINSPLVKTAIFGADPNYGRLMMAVGNSGCKFDLNEVRLTIKGGDMEVPILDSGAPIFQDERAVEVVRMAMDNKEVTIMVDLGVGEETATGWGCDLTYDYVRINAEYAT